MRGPLPLPASAAATWSRASPRERSRPALRVIKGEIQTSKMEARQAGSSTTSDRANQTRLPIKGAISLPFKMQSAQRMQIYDRGGAQAGMAPRGRMAAASPLAQAAMARAAAKAHQRGGSPP